MEIQTRRRRGRPSKGEEPNGERILAAALDAFSVEGFAGANLRAIATAADVDVALIAYRYGSKLALWKAVIDDFSDVIIRQILAGEQDNDKMSCPENLYSAMSNLIDTACDRPQLAQFFVREISIQDNSERSNYIFERLAKPIHEHLLSMIGFSRGGGYINSIDPDFFFSTFVGSLVMIIASRDFIKRFSLEAKEDDWFRIELKKILFAAKWMFEPKSNEDKRG